MICLSPQERLGEIKQKKAAQRQPLFIYFFEFIIILPFVLCQ